MAISALGAGLTGLQANMQALGVEAHNTANMNTQNFVPQTATFNEARPAGTGVTLSIAARDLSAAENVGTAPSGTDPASSITNSLVYKAGFELSAKMIEAADERLGTLIDIRA
ncbi:flagellar basal-body rod protein FlgC [Pseudoduganella lurida]|uniref:Flagellar basal-body rod protein FlgC n=1 Tax=Pseudoduganella lurida TaxID=1036180 RepID=A0A562RF50_9BURK|nr:flagellar basal body rod C-terminal domain-containing protein [Pseudoduganella lurida]TWI67671.1 flagellar basal-body rod protein FlgC [Pseudoduganella lurida]